MDPVPDVDAVAFKMGGFTGAFHVFEGHSASIPLYAQLKAAGDVVAEKQIVGAKLLGPGAGVWWLRRGHWRWLCHRCARARRGPDPKPDSLLGVCRAFPATAIGRQLGQSSQFKQTPTA